MTPDELTFLLTPAGRRLLTEVSATPLTEGNHLATIATLRRRLPPAEARAAVEMAWLRQRATAKFSRAGQMFFTRAALEQASGELIAAHRARRFAALELDSIADLGCGIGGDAIALTAVAGVIGIDRSQIRLRMARENVRAYGRSPFHPVVADLRSLPPLAVNALFFDPARRDEHGRRLRSVDTYRPPLSLVDRWRKKAAAAAVKVSPAIAENELPVDAEVEFISVGGELKEAVLWYGPLRGARRRATLLPAGDTLAADQPPESLPLRRPGAFLYEPDPAVIRASLLDQLASRLKAGQIDPTIAYLATDEERPTPFARGYAIDDVFGFRLKRLRHYLRDRRIGRVTIKKRGSPLDVERLRSRLRLQGDGECTLFLTRVRGEATVLIGRPLSEGGGSP